MQSFPLVVFLARQLRKTWSLGQVRFFGKTVPTAELSKSLQVSVPDSVGLDLVRVALPLAREVVDKVRIPIELPISPCRDISS